MSENLRSLRALDRELTPYGDGSAYQNFIDPDLRDWRRASYGANYPRLVEVKRTYDPGDSFSFPQSIQG